MANRPPRLDLIYQEHDSPLFFVTFNTRKRARILACEPVHECFVDFARIAGKRNIAVGRYVIMPDHVHLFVQGGREFLLPEWVRLLKRRLSRALEPGPEHWQEGFFDHLLRHDESYAEKWEYVRQNPVRAGLSAYPEEWPYQGEIAPIDRV